jgi:hypothetical protein
MKTGFKNNLEVKTQENKNAPWNFYAPPYDERTSCYVNAGSHYGVGNRQPVGNEGEPKMRVPCLPYGRVDTIETRKILDKNEEIDIKR